MDQPQRMPGDADRQRADLEQTHQRLAGWVLRMFRERSGGRGDIADDLSQRTWAVVWDAVQGGRYDPARAAMTTFVYAVAQNIWRQWVRESGRKPGLKAGNDVTEDHPGSTLAEAELIERVRDCLHGGHRAGGLNEEDAEILRMIARGEGDRGLAERLGVAASTANARKRGAMERLRAYLKRVADPTERGNGGRE